MTYSCAMGRSVVVDTDTDIVPVCSTHQTASSNAEKEIVASSNKKTVHRAIGKHGM